LEKKNFLPRQNLPKNPAIFFTKFSQNVEMQNKKMKHVPFDDKNNFS